MTYSDLTIRDFASRCSDMGSAVPFPDTTGESKNNRSISVSTGYMFFNQSGEERIAIEPYRMLTISESRPILGVDNSSPITYVTLLVRRISRLASRRLVAARFFRFSIPTHPFGFGFVNAYDATGYLASAIFVGVLPYQNPLHVASTQIAAAAQHALTHVALEVGVQPLAALEHEVDTAIAHED